MLKLNKNKNGSVLIFTLFVMMMMLVITIGVSVITVINVKTSSGIEESNKAFQLADSGAEKILKILKGSDYTMSGIIDAGMACDDSSGKVVVSENIISGKYEIFFKDEFDNYIANCSDESTTIEKINSVGVYSNASRAVELKVPNSSGCGTVNYLGIDYETVLAADGRCWFKSNLGSDKVATAYDDEDAEGWFYQWGRGSDGHQLHLSQTESMQGSCESDGDPGGIHGDEFFLYDGDWCAAGNDDLWQDVSSYMNNPCPDGWHVPSLDEWNKVVLDEGITDNESAFSSSLKLVMSGNRRNTNGLYYNSASNPIGFYWTSTSEADSQNAYNMYFGGTFYSSVVERGFGMSVRCIKDSGAGGGGAGGGGASVGVISIDSCEELQKIGSGAAYPLDGEYSLINNIDCSATNPSDPNNAGSVWDNGGEGFEPIGNLLSSSPFEGILNGNNYEISNLYIDRGGNSALFEYINGAEISDLGLINVNIHGDGNAGSLIAYSYSSSITNLYVTGSISATSGNAGGLIAFNNVNSPISDSYTNTNVVVLGGTGEAGGLVAANEDSSISNCYTLGSTKGQGFSGGLIGSNLNSSVSGSYSVGPVESNSEHAGGLMGRNRNGSSIINSYATGSVTSGGNGIAGGLVGDNFNSSISNSYATGLVKSNDDSGGLIGFNQDGGDNTISDSYATGSVTGGGGSGDDSGGLIGQNNGGSVLNSYSVGLVIGANAGGLIGSNSGSISNSYWNTQSSGQLSSDGGTSRTTAEMKSYQVPSNENNYNTWKFEPNVNANWKLDEIQQHSDEAYYPCLDWQDDSDCTDIGDISSSIEITNCNELQAIGSAYPLDGEYVLGNNIDCTETSSWKGGDGFEKINNFEGVFDGNLYAIDGLYIDRPSEDNLGLFGVLDAGAEISNLEISNATISGDDYIGGLAGKMTDAKINNIKITNSNISGDDYVGGLAGASVDAIVSNSYVEGGSVFAADDYAGGLIAKSEGFAAKISDSHTSISVRSEDDYAGGLVAYNYYGSDILNSYSTGDVRGKDNYVGGLVGLNNNNQGGNTSIISNSYATGNVMGDRYLGGLAGRNMYDALISNSYATGSVSGNRYFGGLVGYNFSGAEINECYSVGFVDSGVSYFGGLVGYSSSATIYNSYWNVETSGQGSSDGGTGRITNQMISHQMPSNETFYVTWRFEPNVNANWKLDEIQQHSDEAYYPCLDWQDDSDCPISE